MMFEALVRLVQHRLGTLFRLVNIHIGIQIVRLFHFPRFQKRVLVKSTNKAILPNPHMIRLFSSPKKKTLGIA